MGRSIWISLIGAVLVLMGTAPLHAQEDTDLSGVQVTPARTEEDQSDTSVDELVIFVNEEETPQELALSVTPLGHDLDGSPIFVEDGEGLPSLRMDGAGSVVLPPGGRHEVRVEGAFPPGEPGAYFAVVATFAADDPDPDATVQSRVRLGSIFLLRGPRPWDENAEVRDAGILSTLDDGSYRIYADVENLGDVHIRPTGQVDITGADGAALGSVALEREVILPGYARRLVGRWTPPGTPQGPIRLDVELTDPGASADFSIPFPPDLTEDLQIRSLRAARDDAGAPLVVADVVNTGITVLDIVGDLALDEGPGGIAAGPFAAAGVAGMEPGEVAELVVALPGDLPAGPWRAVFTARSGALERAAEATIVFPDEAGTTSDPVEATPILRDRGVLLPLAFGLLILALFLVLLVWLLAKRRREDDQDDGGAGADAEPAVEASP